MDFIKEVCRHFHQLIVQVWSISVLFCSHRFGVHHLVGNSCLLGIICSEITSIFNFGNGLMNYICVVIISF
jgi:hypothetical protein